MDTIRFEVPITDVSIPKQAQICFGVRDMNKAVNSGFGRRLYYRNNKALWEKSPAKPVLYLVCKKYKKVGETGMEVRRAFLTVEISVAKLLKGLNIFELNGDQSEYYDFISKLNTLLAKAEIKIDSFDKAVVKRVDIAKNIILKNLGCGELIMMMSNMEMKKLGGTRYDNVYTAYTNGGSSQTFNKPSTKKPDKMVQFYNKPKDLARSSKSQIGMEEQLYKKLIDKLPEILRLEVRLLNNVAISAELRELDRNNDSQPDFRYGDCKLLKDFFDRELWIDILINNLKKIFTNYNIGVITDSLTNPPDFVEESNIGKLAWMIMCLTGPSNYLQMKELVLEHFSKSFYYKHFAKLIQETGGRLRELNGIPATVPEDSENGSDGFAELGRVTMDTYDELMNIHETVKNWVIINPIIASQLIIEKNGVEDGKKTSN